MKANDNSRRPLAKLFKEEAGRNTTWGLNDPPAARFASRRGSINALKRQ